jgi:hypothetical protein
MEVNAKFITYIGIGAILIFTAGIEAGLMIGFVFGLYV